jgi:hypothetical protein
MDEQQMTAQLDLMLPTLSADTRAQVIAARLLTATIARATAEIVAAIRSINQE